MAAGLVAGTAAVCSMDQQAVHVRAAASVAAVMPVDSAAVDTWAVAVVATWAAAVMAAVVTGKDSDNSSDNKRDSLMAVPFCCFQARLLIADQLYQSLGDLLGGGWMGLSFGSHAHYLEPRRIGQQRD